MRVLIDTHTLLWLIQDEDQLSAAARQVLRLRSTEPFVSVVSLWELAIKMSKGKLELDRPLSELVDQELPSNGIELLAIGRNHLLAVQELPFPYEGHADPFDRMLVAQAIAEDLELLSADAKLDAYGVRRTW